MPERPQAHGELLPPTRCHHEKTVFGQRAPEDADGPARLGPVDARAGSAVTVGARTLVVFPSSVPKGGCRTGKAKRPKFIFLNRGVELA
jgi:hypothetical protein